MQSFNATTVSQQQNVLQLLPDLTLGNVCTALAVCFATWTVVNAFRKPRYPSTLPWVGGKGWLSSFKGLVHSRTWLQEGYDKYSKNGRAFIFPGLIGNVPEIVVPPSQMAWLLEQPDDVLSTSAAHYDALHGDYSFLSPRILEDPYHEHVVHRSLARNLNALIPGLEDEVRHCVDDAFGTDTERWTSVNVWDALLAIVPKLTNRMLVGQSICRNQEYLDNMVAFTNDVVRNLLVFTFVPRPLRPLVGPLLGLANQYHYSKTAKHTLPIVTQRLADFAAKSSGDPAYEDWEAPNDYITWHIRLAQAEGRADELDPVLITMRLVPINFASIHTTVLTMHATLLDLLSADPARGFLSGIREEAEAAGGGAWTKESLARLVRADSAVRESMRVSTFAQTLVQRKVVARGGLDNAAEGWHAPRGGTLSLALHATQHDPALFADAEDYDAFRHSRAREAYTEDQGPEEGLRVKKMGMITTGETHFPWGHGRHACPGRFFVAHELKMILAYLVLNYDITPLSQRPPIKWIGTNMIPPTDARIEVKRRSGTVSQS